MEYKRVCIHIIVKTIEFGVKNRTTDKNISIKNKWTKTTCQKR